MREVNSETGKSNVYYIINFNRHLVVFHVGQGIFTVKILNNHPNKNLPPEVHFYLEDPLFHFIAYSVKGCGIHQRAESGGFQVALRSN